VDVREIRVVTTRAGAVRVREQLLHPTHGWFHRFCRDFRIPPGRIHFDGSCILVPADKGGGELEDVRTPSDNALVADTILSLVRDLTRDPNTALHCSVAGGRKTMGLFLGIAFQLFARPGDQLSHVLVWPPELEGHREFFYLPPRPAKYTVNGRTIQSRDIRVELAEIPVLLLREGLHAADLEGQSYTGLIARAQREIDRLASPPPLILEDKSRSLHIEDQVICLTPLEFAVYRLLTHRRIAGCAQPGCRACPKCSLEAREFLGAAIHDELRGSLTAIGVRDHRARSLPGWQSSGDERFLQVRSRINAKIRKGLGPGRWTERYRIAAHRAPGALTRYLIPVDPSRIILG
jgi:CRISPR-associated protein (TIGR02584 family)